MDNRDGVRWDPNCTFSQHAKCHVTLTVQQHHDLWTLLFMETGKLLRIDAKLCGRKSLRRCERGWIWAGHCGALGLLYRVCSVVSPGLCSAPLLSGGGGGVVVPAVVFPTAQPQIFRCPPPISASGPVGQVCGSLNVLMEKPYDHTSWRGFHIQSTFDCSCH